MKDRALSPISPIPQGPGSDTRCKQTPARRPSGKIFELVFIFFIVFLACSSLVQLPGAITGTEQARLWMHDQQRWGLFHQ